VVIEEEAWLDDTVYQADRKVLVNNKTDNDQ